MRDRRRGRRALGLAFGAAALSISLYGQGVTVRGPTHYLRTHGYSVVSESCDSPAGQLLHPLTTSRHSVDPVGATLLGRVHRSCAPLQSRQDDVVFGLLAALVALTVGPLLRRRRRFGMHAGNVAGSALAEVAT